MKIFINDDSVDKKLSETIKKMLIKNNYQIIDFIKFSFSSIH